MKEDFIEKLIIKIVSNYIGQESEKLVKILYDKKNVNEFHIAKKLALTINQTRNILYKLSDEGLVTFIRKKDKKKGGWYTYFWTLKTEKSLYKFKEKIDENANGLQAKLKDRETERFFYCKNCENEYSEEEALLNNYTCPECGETLEIDNKEKIVIHIKNEIKRNSDLLEQITEELKKIQLKENKLREKRMKAEQKKKEIERKNKAKKRKREKLKEMSKEISKKKLKERNKSKPKKISKKKK